MLDFTPFGFFHSGGEILGPKGLASNHQEATNVHSYRCKAQYSHQHEQIYKQASNIEIDQGVNNYLGLRSRWQCPGRGGQQQHTKCSHGDGGWQNRSDEQRGRRSRQTLSPGLNKTTRSQGPFDVLLLPTVTCALSAAS